MGKKILLSTLRLKRKMEANDMGTIIVLIVLAIIIALIIRAWLKIKKPASHFSAVEIAASVADTAIKTKTVVVKVPDIDWQ